MSRPRAARSLLALLLLLPAACGGSGGGASGPAPAQGEFVVPPRPSSLLTQSGLNQAPPAELLAGSPCPRPTMRPAPVGEEERDAAAAAALQAARAHLGALGWGDGNDVVLDRVVRDEHGTLHVKLHQVYGGVHVRGAGVVVHLYADMPTGFTLNVVPGLDLTTTPGVPESAAWADALERYGDRGVTAVGHAQLMVDVEWKYVPVRRTASTPNRADYDRELAASRLVWVVEVGPELPDPAEVLRAMLDGPTPPADDEGEATQTTRREETTRAGQPVPASTTGSLVARVLTPTVRYLVDAQTGAILSAEDLIEHEDFVPASGVGHGYYNGTVPLDTARWGAGGSYYLHDIVRPDTSGYDFKVGNLVLDAHNVATHDAQEMTWITDGNNEWGDGSIVNSEGSALGTTRRQTPGVDVAYGVQMTWDFLDHVVGRWGPSGDGTPTRACVHYDDGYGDAHYDGASGFACFGDGGQLDSAGHYYLTVVGHELGHAYWHGAGNGTSTSTSRALNEGHGDICGNLTVFYRETGLGVGTQVRRFNNFAAWRGRDVDPDGYTETDDDGVVHTGLKYWTPDLQDKPPHVGGLPYARAMIYLAEGSPADETDPLWTSEWAWGIGGIGLTRAAHVWQIATSCYVAGSPDYMDIRNAFVDAAGYLFGPSSMEQQAARRAFAGIRVGALATDLEDPVIAYAQVFAVDPRDMTALVFAWPTDDTGFRETRVDGYDNHGVYKGDFVLGFADISEVPVGEHEFTFTLEDGAGRTASVQRPFLKVRDRNLIQNGNFESGMSGWTSFSGEGRVADYEPNAFIGNGYMTMEGEDKVWQEVTIPASAQDVTLVYRLLVRNQTIGGETLSAEIQTMSSVLQVLAAYDRDTPQDTRNFVNKGYLRQEFDLSAYAGQTIRIAFVNHTAAGAYRFLIDQVALTYVEDVTVGLPEVTVNSWENTVSFRLPEIHGLPAVEIDRVDWYVDNVFVGAGRSPYTDYFGAWFLGPLGPGAHWVAGRVRGLDNAALADTVAVWFEQAPVHELLTNGGFEGGAWDLTYSTPPPGVVVVQDAPGLPVAFDGAKALRMGGQGVAGASQAGQAVLMPVQMATLDFSVRLKVASLEPAPVPDPQSQDGLWLELWDLSTYQLLAKLPVASFMDVYTSPGTQEGWRGYVRRNVSIPPGLVAGKNVLVRLSAEEDAGDATWFTVDDASLRYTQYGVAFGG